MARATPPRRLLAKVLLVVPAVLLIVVAATPWLLGTSMGRSLVLKQANRLVSPSRIELASLQLSWFGQVRLAGLTLHAPGGKAVVLAPEGCLDRGAWQLLFDRPHYGTLTLIGAVVDIERRADGSIDLADALHPILAPDPNHKSDPRTDFTLRIVAGSLRLRSPEFAEPMVAERLDLTLRAPQAPGPLSWEISLANPQAGAEAATIKGRYDHRATEGTTADLTLSIEGRQWPAALAVAGGAGRGRLDGTIELARRRGAWKTTGVARVLALDATGPALAGDRLRIDRVETTWDVAEVGPRWAVRRLELKSSLATLSAQGTLATPAHASATIQARLDLAALARQIPHALHLREGLALDRGLAELRGEIRDQPEGPALDFVIGLSDLAAHDGTRAIQLDDPATLSARFIREAHDLLIERVSARTAFGDIEASGDLARGVQLTGNLDLRALREKLGALVDFGKVDLAGRARVSGSYSHAGAAYTGQLTADVSGLSIAGLTTEPIRHDRLRLEAHSQGPAGASGLPTGWSTATLGVEGADLKAAATAARRAEATELRANVESALKTADRAGRAEGRLAGRWQGRALTIDEVRATLRPADPRARAATIAITARGRYDVAGGTVVLEPLPGVEPGGIAPAAEGIRVDGLGGTGQSLKVEGRLTADLAALDRAHAYWTANEPTGVAGALTAQVVTQHDLNGLLRFGVRLDSSDFTRPGEASRGRRAEGPIALLLRGSYRPDADRIDLVECDLGSRFGGVKAAGKLDEPGGRRLIDLKGTLTPDWALINALVAWTIEPKARLRAEARPFRVRALLSGGSVAEILRNCDAELGVNLVEAEAFGVQVGPAPVVVRCGGGRVTIDPISTTVNGGRLELMPRVALDDRGGITLRLDPGSVLKGAEINDEVSTRVLSYVAPILHEATRVSGHLSVAVDRAEFPIVAAAGRSTVVDGRITFEDVSYGPGPLVQQLLGVIGERRVPALRLEQTVPFRVAEGKVSQQGLAIAVSPQAKIVLDGAVGFDKSLALRAAVPITGAMLGDERLLGQIVEGARIEVPIGGTMSHPAIDRGALQVALRDTSRTLLRRGAAVGASEMLRRLDRAGDGGAAPRPGRPRLAEDALRLLLPGADADGGR